MNKQEKQLVDLTKEFFSNHPPEKLNGSLTELYFSLTSITLDLPTLFPAISSNVHALIKYFHQVKQISNSEISDGPKRTRTRKIKNAKIGNENNTN